MSREPTQPASATRLVQARKRGKVAQSSILVGTFVLAAGLGATFLAFSKMIDLAKTALRNSLLPARWYDALLLPDFRALPWMVLTACAPIAVAALLAGIAGAWIQHGPLFAVGRERERRGILASGAAWEGLLTLAVTALAFVCFAFFAARHSRDVVSLTGRPVLTVFAAGSLIVRDFVWTTIVVLLGLGCVDWVLRRIQLRAALRMTREEALREERDNSGDPLVRSERRRRSHA